MIREKLDELGDEENENVRERKAVEMENRRRAMLERSETKQRLRQTHIERREATKAVELEQAKKAFDTKILQAERARRLAEELSLRKHFEQQEFFKKRKARNAVSLVSSRIAEDMEAKLTEERKREKEKEMALNSKLSDVWPYTDDNLNAKQEQEKKLNYRRELQNQLIDNRRRERERAEEKHRERKLLEEVGETLYKEDLETEKRTKDTALLLQAEREAFLKARQMWKDKRREVLRREYDEISRLIADKETLLREEAKKKTDTRAMKDALVETIGNKIKAEEHRRREREEICRELYLAENEDKLANEAVMLASKKKRTAKELLQDMARHRKAVAERKAKEDAIDAALSRHLAEERRKLEEKEKQKKQVLREKSMRYGDELREAITKNKMEYLQDVAQRRSEIDRDEASGRQAMDARKGKAENEICANRGGKSRSEMDLKA